MSPRRPRGTGPGLRIDPDQRPSEFRPDAAGRVPSRTFRAPKRVDDVTLGPEHTGEEPIQLVAPRPEPAPVRTERQVRVEEEPAPPRSRAQQKADEEEEARREAHRQVIRDAIASGRAKVEARKRAEAEEAALLAAATDDGEEWEDEAEEEEEEDYEEWEEGEDEEDGDWEEEEESDVVARAETAPAVAETVKDLDLGPMKRTGSMIGSGGGNASTSTPSPLRFDHKRFSVRRKRRRR